MAKHRMAFEKAMARLEEIVVSIEQGEIGLEDSIKRFEEGMSLIRQCRTVLADAEMKIQHLQASGAEGIESVEPSENAGT